MNTRLTPSATSSVASSQSGRARGWPGWIIGALAAIFAATPSAGRAAGEEGLFDNYYIGATVDLHISGEQTIEAEGDLVLPSGDFGDVDLGDDEGFSFGIIIGSGSVTLSRIYFGTEVEIAFIEPDGLDATLSVTAIDGEDPESVAYKFEPERIVRLSLVGGLPIGNLLFYGKAGLSAVSGSATGGGRNADALAIGEHIGVGVEWAFDQGLFARAETLHTVFNFDEDALDISDYTYVTGELTSLRMAVGLRL